MLKITCRHCNKPADELSNDLGSNAVIHLQNCRKAQKFALETEGHRLDGNEDEEWAISQFSWEGLTDQKNTPWRD